MRFGKPISLAMSAILASALCPGLAMAQTSRLEGDALTAGAPALNELTTAAKAKKVTVYVVTKRSSAFYPGVGMEASAGFTNTFSYNKNGLLKNEKQVGSDNTICKWAYKGNVISKIAKLRGEKVSFKIKNGKRVSATVIAPESYYNKRLEKYTYSKGKVSKVTTEEYKGREEGSSSTVTYKYNAKGLPVKQVRTTSSGKFVTTYKYDKRGNLVKETKDGTPTKHQLKYDKLGRVKSKSDGTWVDSYTYKKLKVSSAQAKLIKEQQWNLINDNLRFGIGNLYMTA